MKLRAVTCFIEPGNPIDEARVSSAAKLLAAAKSAFESAGYEVQTLRLALPPLARTFGPDTIESAVKYAQDLEALCFVHSLDCASLGVARPADPPGYFDVIPAVLGGTESIFAAAVIASPLDGLSLAASRRTASLIQRNAGLTPDGLANMRFAALANVEPGSPFFPAAYHEGGSPSFAVATEAADLAVQAFTGAGSLAEAHIRLVSAIEGHAKEIQSAARRVGTGRGVRFAGIDFSLAPYPAPDRSIGAALEALGPAQVGGAGMVAAAAFVADAIHAAKFSRAGFCGLLLPVIEDSLLAQRAAEGMLTINDLLLYATVCGSGLDAVPLPGDVTAEDLAPLLIDIAALALRHNKPLTARLLPMPGKQAGDSLTFDSPYLANGAVLSLKQKTHPLSGAFDGSDSFDLAKLM